jgi:hypothetical protein
VVLAVDAQQPFGLDVGVDFRGRDVGMAEQELHGAQVGPALQQVGGEAVAHGVRRDLGAHPGHEGIALDELPHGLTREPPAERFRNIRFSTGRNCPRQERR